MYIFKYKKLNECYRTILIIVSSFLLMSCVHSSGIASSDLNVMSEMISKKIDINRNKKIYISLQDKFSDTDIVSKIKKDISHNGFKVVKKPTSADIILQITVPFSGNMSLASLKNAVEKGYDTKIKHTGGDITAFIVDVLLVTRTVPKGKDAHQTKLKNISQRQATDSSTFRLAVYSSKIRKINPLPSSFISLLSSEICKKLSLIFSI